MRGPGASTLLERMLRASADAAGATITVDAISARGWSSATFTGERHVVDLRGASGDAFDAWLAALPAADLDLRGHMLADLAIDHLGRAGGTTSARVNALTVAAG